MKEIEIKIKIYQWSDLKKWFWDSLCFPRRKKVAEWLDYYCCEERSLGKSTIQCCLPDMRGRINGIEIEHFKCEYVHQYQHLLRLCGLDELADNFKI